ncbi:hypothetical protein ACH40D_21110 [Streptomyces olivaceoviridis]|uniref:Uncharacterized protein n=1 Tax=Streptomyces olivaceoviridis TaxID=1921 RepID=A0ABW7VKB9_STROI|nr:hypothetical protein [Streptomyces corchorusii]
MFTTATSGVDAHHQGIASAMASTTQQAGSAVGLAILVAVANSGVQATTGPTFVPGLRTTGPTAAALTLLGVAIAPSLRSVKPPRGKAPHDGSQEPECPPESSPTPGRGEDGQLLTRSRPHHPK